MRMSPQQPHINVKIFMNILKKTVITLILMLCSVACSQNSAFHKNAGDELRIEESAFTRWRFSIDFANTNTANKAYSATERKITASPILSPDSQRADYYIEHYVMNYSRSEWSVCDCGHQERLDTDLSGYRFLSASVNSKSQLDLSHWPTFFGVVQDAFYLINSTWSDSAQKQGFGIDWARLWNLYQEGSIVSGNSAVSVVRVPVFLPNATGVLDTSVLALLLVIDPITLVCECSIDPN